MARLQYDSLNDISYRKDHVNLWGVPLDGVIEFKDDADTYGRHKYSAGETDNDYKDAVLELVSFMKEHDLYVPDDLQSARGAAAITRKEDLPKASPLFWCLVGDSNPRRSRPLTRPASRQIRFAQKRFALGVSEVRIFHKTKGSSRPLKGDNCFRGQTKACYLRGTKALHGMGLGREGTPFPTISNRLAAQPR